MIGAIDRDSHCMSIGTSYIMSSHMLPSPYLDSDLLVLPTPKVDRPEAALAEQVTQRDVLERAATAGGARLQALHAARDTQGCRGTARGALDSCRAAIETPGRSLTRLQVFERRVCTLTWSAHGRRADARRRPGRGQGVVSSQAQHCADVVLHWILIGGYVRHAGDVDRRHPLIEDPDRSGPADCRTII